MVRAAERAVTTAKPRATPKSRRHDWWHPRRWLSARELSTLTVLSLLAAGLWIFIRLAQYVQLGEVARIDERLVLAMRTADPTDPIGPRWFEEMMRDFTALGGLAVLGPLTAAAIVYLVLIGKRGTAVTAFVAVAGGIAVSLLLKDFFDRPRPDLVPHGSHVYTKSFPSGHSMLSAVTYLTLGVMLVRIQPRRLLKIYIIVVALLTAGLAGVSRVYLGVHWPSDVLAGWAAGSVWALFVWGVTHLLQRTGEIEPESESE
jgi:undecaprenyl-diphosphatase